MSAEDFYIGAKFAVPSILILLYLLVLVHVVCGSKYRFVIWISFALFISAVSNFLFTLFTQLTHHHPNFPIFLVYTAYFLGSSTFNSAHWVFAYKYFETSIQVRHLFNQSKIPETQLKLMKYMFWILLALNILVPLGYAIAGEYYHLHAPNGVKIVYTLFLVSGLCQLISGIVLTFAIFSIRNFLVNSGYKHRVNYKNFTIHAVCFALYIISLLIYYIGFGLLASTDATNVPQKLLYILFFVYYAFAFVEQVILVVIFMKFGEKTPQA